MDFDSSLQSNMNLAKDSILEELERQGLLRQPADKLKSEYAIILVKRGFFGKFLDILFNVPEDTMQCRVVKICAHCPVEPNKSCQILKLDRESGE